MAMFRCGSGGVQTNFVCAFYLYQYSTTFVTISVDTAIGVNTQYVSIDNNILTIKKTGKYKLYGCLGYPSDSIPECYYVINGTATRICQYGSGDIRELELNIGDTLYIKQKQPNAGRPINNNCYLVFVE